MKKTNDNSRKISFALVASYWLLALPTLLKTRGGYLIGREVGNEFIENGFFWLRLVKGLWTDAIPLWAPHVHAGYPIIGNPKVALFHPFTLTTILGDPASMANAWMYATAAIGACGMWLFCRELGLSRFSSWLGGIVFGFHPYYAGQIFVSGNWSFLLAYWAIPYSLWITYKIAKTGSWQTVGFAAMIFSFLITSLHLPLVLLSLLLTLFLCLLTRTPNRSKLFGFVKWVAAVALAVLISAPSLVPGVHFWQQTANSVPIENARDYPLARILPEHLLSLFFPRFFGDEVNSVYWGRLSYSACALYSGICAVVLCVFAAFHAQRRRLAIYTLGALGACIILAAEVFPIFGKLCEVPGWLQWTSSPSFFLSLFPVFIGLAVALGWEAIQTRPVAWRRRAGQVLLVVTFLAALIGWLYFGRSGGTGLLWKSLVQRITSDPMSGLPLEIAQKLRREDRLLEAAFQVASSSVLWSLLFLASFALLLVFGFAHDARPRAGTLSLLGLLFSADLVAFYHSQESIYPVALLDFPKQVGAYLQKTCGNDYRCLAPLDPDLCLAPAQSGVRNAWVRTPFVYRDFHDLVRVQERLAIFYAPGLMMTRLTPLTKAMGVKTLVSRPHNVYRSELSTVTLQTNRVWVYETTNSLPRVFFPKSIVSTTQSISSLFNVSSLDWNPEEVGYVDLNTLVVPTDFSQPRGTTVTITSETGRNLRIHFSKPTTSSCILMLSDLYDPWWKAYVDNTQVPIGKGNYAFRAVAIPPNTQELNLRYQVPYSKTLWILSALGMIVSVFLLSVSRIGRFVKKNV